MLGGNLANIIQVVCVISNSTEYNICKEIEHRVMYHTKVILADWQHLPFTTRLVILCMAEQLKVKYGKNPKLTFEDGRRYLAHNA